MSFILDALKNLEQKRHNETAPDLMTIHTEARTEQKKHPLLTYIMVAVLLLNAVVLAAWLRPQQEDNNSQIAQAAKKDINTPGPVVPNSNEAVIKNETPAIQDVNEPAIKTKTTAIQEAVKINTPDITIPEKQEAAIETASLPINPSPDELKTLKNIIAEEQLSAANTPSFEPGVEENSVPDVEEDNAPPAERRVIDMSQLPLSIRKELPDLNIAGHIYSNDPMSRLVNINGSIIREGGTVTTGLNVNEITVSGVVLDYGGLLFSIRAF